MIIKSKEAVKDLKEFFEDTQKKYPYRKDGILRKNASRRTRQKIAKDYIQFVTDFISLYVRPKKEGERVDICGIIIPAEEDKILYKILNGAHPFLYASYGLEVHKDDCDEVWFDTEKVYTIERG